MAWLCHYEIPQTVHRLALSLCWDIMGQCQAVVACSTQSRGAGQHGNLIGLNMGVSKNSGTQKIMENPIQMDDLGVPIIFGNTHMTQWTHVFGTASKLQHAIYPRPVEQDSNETRDEIEAGRDKHHRLVVPVSIRTQAWSCCLQVAYLIGHCKNQTLMRWPRCLRIKSCMERPERSRCWKCLLLRHHLDMLPRISICALPLVKLPQGQRRVLCVQKAFKPYLLFVQL